VGGLSIRGIEEAALMARKGCWKCEHRQHGVLMERSAGSVSLPQKAFIAALRMGEE
jgi:hypothetical protein